MWRDIGLDPEIFNMAYTAHRPRLVERTLNYPWLFVNPGVDDPFEDPRGPLWTTVESGANPGMEIPHAYDLHQQIQASDDPLERRMLNEELIDFEQEQMFMTAIVSVPGLYTFNPKNVSNWSLNRYSPINRLEFITPP
jgi:hypothetical protein